MNDRYLNEELHFLVASDEDEEMRKLPRNIGKYLQDFKKRKESLIAALESGDVTPEGLEHALFMNRGEKLSPMQPIATAEALDHCGHKETASKFAGMLLARL